MTNTYKTQDQVQIVAGGEKGGKKNDTETKHASALEATLENLGVWKYKERCLSNVIVC